MMSIDLNWGGVDLGWGAVLTQGMFSGYVGQSELSRHKVRAGVEPPGLVVLSRDGLSLVRMCMMLKDLFLALFDVGLDLAL